MRHFLVVVGAVAGNFMLWSLITKLPAPDIILFALAIAIGCLMLYVIVRFGGEKKTVRQLERSL